MLDLLKDNWYWILIAVIVIVVLIVVICLRPKKDKTANMEEKVENDKNVETIEQPQEEPVENKEEPSEVNEDEEQDDEEEITFESTEELDEEVSQEEKTKEATRPKQYRISYDREQKMWLIKKDGAKRVIRKTKTKSEAVEIAKTMCNNQDLNLVVQKKDGKFQKKKNVH